MALSLETITIRAYREKRRRREENPTPEDVWEMKREAQELERYLEENPDLFNSK